jgi:hypothetical protein
VRVFSTQPVAEATSLLAYAAAFTGGLFVAGTPLAASPPMAPAPATAPNQAIENIVAPVDPGSAMVHLADHGNETGDDLDDWIPFSPDAEARSAALALEEDWLSPLEAQQ